MILFFILGSIMAFAFGVVGFLFYMLNKQSTEKEKVVAVNLKDLKSSFVSPEKTKFSEPIDVPTGYGVSHSSQEYLMKEAVYQKRVSELEEELLAAQKVQQKALEDLTNKELSYQKRSAELEEELQKISQEAQAQSREALVTINGLMVHNEKLKIEQSTRVTSAEANLIKAQENVKVMLDEQGVLQGRLTESELHVQELQDEVIFVKEQMAKEVVKSKSMIDDLMSLKETLLCSTEAAVADAVNVFRNDIDRLTNENQSFKNAFNDLTLTNQKLKELNDHLIEKSEALQWELTKSRAQMTSYERACENYQIQLRGAFDRTDLVEEDYSKLTESNGSMQNTLDELQNQNQELSKRQKLFEFELEKNRGQLVVIQMAYENLKATTSSSPSQP